MKILNKPKVRTEVQDLYSIYKSSGHPLSRILSFGYIELSDDAKFQDLSVERRTAILIAREFLSVVVSEVLKSDEYRDKNKMIGFLKMAMEQIDKHYEGIPKINLWHGLNPPEK